MDPRQAFRRRRIRRLSERITSLERGLVAWHKTEHLQHTAYGREMRAKMAGKREVLSHRMERLTIGEGGKVYGPLAGPFVEIGPPGPEL